MAKIVVRVIIACLLLLPAFGSLVGPAPAIAANAVVHFVSNDVGGAWTNQGYVYVAMVQYSYGQWYIFNTGTYRLDAEDCIISGGNRYDFDHWGYDGAVTITDLYNHTTSITITGEGDVYAFYVLQDFTLSVTPSNVEIQSPNTAQYSFTVTRTNIPHDVNRAGMFVDLSASGLWLSSVTRWQFIPATATFYYQSTQSSITGTLYINTVDASAGQYNITVNGQIRLTSTSHETQVTLRVDPSPGVYPDLVITDFSWTPSNPTVGQAISITYTEKNQGEGDALGHRNALYIDGVLISNDDVDPLAAGASRTRTFSQTWTVSSGPHVVHVEADTTKVVYEGESGSDRETNNSLDKTLGSKIGTQLTVAVNPTSVPPGSGTLVTVSGKLTRTDTGAGMADRSVTLNSPGISTFARTNSAGDYSYSYITPNLVEGSDPVTVYFEGDSYFDASSAQTNLGVGKIPTSITINLNPPSISSGTPTTVTVSGKLSRSDTSAGLNGKSVELGWPTGSTTVTTDSSGSYSYSLTVTTTQNWVFQATFSGDSTYLQSSKTTVLSVIVANQPPTVSRVSPSSSSLSLTVGATQSFTASASDPDGNLAGMDWYVNGGSSRRSASLSGSSGQDSFSFTFTSAGTYTVEAQAHDSGGLYSPSPSPAIWTVTVPPQTQNAEIASVSTDKAAYGPNEVVKVTVKVKNTGNVALSGLSVNVDIANPSGSSVIEGVFQDGISLATGEEKTFTKDYWTVPSSPQAGTYTVTAGLHGDVPYHEEKAYFNVSEEAFIKSMQLNRNPAVASVSSIPYSPGGESEHGIYVFWGDYYLEGVYAYVTIENPSDTEFSGKLGWSLTDPDGTTIESETIPTGLMDFLEIKPHTSQVERLWIRKDYAFSPPKLSPGQYQINVFLAKKTGLISYEQVDQESLTLKLVADNPAVAYPMKDIDGDGTVEPIPGKQFYFYDSAQLDLTDVQKGLVLADFVLSMLTGAEHNFMLGPLLMPLPCLSTATVYLDDLGANDGVTDVWLRWWNVYHYPDPDFARWVAADYDRACICLKLPSYVEVVDNGGADFQKEVGDSQYLIWYELGVDKLIKPTSADNLRPQMYGGPNNAYTIKIKPKPLALETTAEIETTIELQFGPLAYEPTETGPLIYDYAKWQEKPEEVYWGTVGVATDKISVELPSSELRTAVDEGKVGALITVEAETPTGGTEIKPTVSTDIISPELSVETHIKPQKVELDVSSTLQTGKTVVIDIDNDAMLITDARGVTVLLDGKEIGMADTYAEVLQPSDESVPKYWVEVGATATLVLVWIQSFSTHTITVAKVPTFKVSNLTISPPEVMAGEPVRISMNVTNDGGIGGSYVLALNISGAVEATKSLTLEGGETEVVAFELTKRAEGTYGVEVAGLTGTFVVKVKPINWLLIGGIVAAVALVGIAVGWRLKSKKRKPAGTT